MPAKAIGQTRETAPFLYTEFMYTTGEKNYINRLYSFYAIAKNETRYGVDSVRQDITKLKGLKLWSWVAMCRAVYRNCILKLIVFGRRALW